MKLLEVRNLKKTYTTRFGGSQVQALRNVSFTVDSGDLSLSWENPVPEKLHF